MEAAVEQPALVDQLSSFAIFFSLFFFVSLLRRESGRCRERRKRGRNPAEPAAEEGEASRGVGGKARGGGRRRGQAPKGRCSLAAPGSAAAAARGEKEGEERKEGGGGGGGEEDPPPPLPPLPLLPLLLLLLRLALASSGIIVIRATDTRGALSDLEDGRGGAVVARLE